MEKMSESPTSIRVDILRRKVLTHHYDEVSLLVHFHTLTTLMYYEIVALGNSSLSVHLTVFKQKFYP